MSELGSRETDTNPGGEDLHVYPQEHAVPQDLLSTSSKYPWYLPQEETGVPSQSHLGALVWSLLASFLTHHLQVEPIL